MHGENKKAKAHLVENKISFLCICEQLLSFKNKNYMDNKSRDKRYSPRTVPTSFRKLIFKMYVCMHMCVTHVYVDEYACVCMLMKTRGQPLESSSETLLTSSKTES